MTRPPRPKWGTPTNRKGDHRKKTLRLDVGRLWIINSRPAEFSENENEILEEQATTAKAFLANKRGYFVDTIRFPANMRFAREARLGDLAIVLHNVGKTTDVFPPVRVLYTRAYRADGVARIGVHLECPEAGDAFRWGPFRKAALAAGVKVGKHTCREIRNLGQHEPLLSFFKK